MKKPDSAIRLHGLLFVLVLVVDQLTKYWARARFSLPNGEPDYAEHIAVLGDWLHLRLVYNYGAAFGMRPQDILPFLHPIVFYAIFSAVAITLLGLYYWRLGPREKAGRLGLLLILAGAFGNLIDRMAMHRVTDFLDAGIPGFYPRWPVFNIADSSVFIGIILLIVPPFFARRAPSPASSGPPENAPEPGGSPSAPAAGDRDTTGTGAGHGG